LPSVWNHEYFALLIFSATRLTPESAIMVSLHAIRSLILSFNALNQTDRVIANIDTLTDMAQSLQHPAQSLKFLDSAQFLCDKGGFPGIVSNMTNITTTVSHFLDEMTGQPLFEAGVVSQKIVDDFIIVCIQSSTWRMKLTDDSS
jgi:hypothetical protein